MVFQLEFPVHLFIRAAQLIYAILANKAQT